MNNNENMNGLPNSNGIDKIVVQLIQKCTPFLSPDDVQLGRKFYDLNLLYAMWNKDSDEGDNTSTYNIIIC